MNYIAKYQNRYAVPLSSSLSLRGERSNDGGVWRNEGMGIWIVFPGLVSRPAWFDGFLLSQERQWRVVLSKGIAFSTDFLWTAEIPFVLHRKDSGCVAFHPLKTCPYLRGERGQDSKFSINPGDSFWIPYIHSVQYTLLSKYLRCASACGLSSVWIVGSFGVSKPGIREHSTTKNQLRCW